MSEFKKPDCFPTAFKGASPPEPSLVKALLNRIVPYIKGTA